MTDCDNCAICREKLENNIYTVPECNHKFHTNCIMTWFRTGYNRCPLCQDHGINTINDMYEKTNWSSRDIAFSNYKKIRSRCRNKHFNSVIKKKIVKIEKLEKKYKQLLKEIKTFDNTTHPELTTKEVLRKYRLLRGRKWRLVSKIRREKELIGFSTKITDIIIPRKINLY